jgi:hypothetical protein
LGIHDRLCQECNYRTFENVSERLDEPVANHSLRLRTENVEGERVVEDRIVRTLEREHPDLGTIAVSHDDVVPLADEGQLLYRVDDVMLLNFGRRFLASL